MRLVQNNAGEGGGAGHHALEEAGRAGLLQKDGERRNGQGKDQGTQAAHRQA